MKLEIIIGAAEVLKKLKTVEFPGEKVFELDGLFSELTSYIDRWYDLLKKNVMKHGTKNPEKEDQYFIKEGSPELIEFNSWAKDVLSTEIDFKPILLDQKDLAGLKWSSNEIQQMKLLGFLPSSPTSDEPLPVVKVEEKEEEK